MKLVKKNNSHSLFAFAINSFISGPGTVLENLMILLKFKMSDQYLTRKRTMNVSSKYKTAILVGIVDVNCTYSGSPAHFKPRRWPKAATTTMIQANNKHHSHGHNSSNLVKQQKRMDFQTENLADQLSFRPLISPKLGL